MDVNPQNLRTLYVSLSTAFNARFLATPSLVGRIATEVNSTTAANEYPRLDDIPGVREWIGDRVVHNLSAATYQIRNKTWEGTFSVKREQIEDDQIGLFRPAAEQLGQNAAQFPDILAFGLLKRGNAEIGPDGQYFFDTDHPGYTETGAVASVSNFQAGAGAPWFLVDDTNVLKPIILQKRRAFTLTSKDNVQRDDNVFERNEYVYGTDGRLNVGLGLWQTAFMSKAPLTQANYEAARAAMGSIRKRDGSAIAINPRLLIVPPSLEGAAKAVVQATALANGATNVWAGTAEILVTAHVA